MTHLQILIHVINQTVNILLLLELHRARLISDNDPWIWIITATLKQGFSRVEKLAGEAMILVVLMQIGG